MIGDVNPDIVVSDADPVPVFGQAERFVEGIRLTIGGSSAIAACAAARLGLRVRLVGVVGDDELGRFMLEAVAAAGVDVSACRVAIGRTTGASVVLGNASDRAILTAAGTIADLRAADVRPALAPGTPRAPGQLLPAARPRARRPGAVRGGARRGRHDEPRPQLGPDRRLGRRVRRGRGGIGRPAAQSPPRPGT